MEEHEQRRHERRHQDDAADAENDCLTFAHIAFACFTHLVVLGHTCSLFAS